MTLSRRRFLGQAAPMGLLPLLPACGAVEELPELEPPGAGNVGNVFQHGVASGDPLADAVVLWTRVTPSEVNGLPEGAPVQVEWRMTRDPELRVVVGSGSASASADSDYTLKIDAGGLEGDTTYYYAFSVRGKSSPIGRTKTLPSGASQRARLAVVSCANYCAGYFNAYRLIAARSDLDLVLHLGDYLYEYANGTFGDGSAIGRVPEPNRELYTLADYRARHAQYKTDPDLQEAHRQHPFLAIWDDHEIADNGFRDGAGNHQGSEGDWPSRKRDALRAYFEWMPVRPPSLVNPERIYRQFAYGDLFDLMLLDTRYAGRSPMIATYCDRVGLSDESRQLLGVEQEEWFFDALRSSNQRGTRWRLVGQQVMLAQLSDTSLGCVTHPDQWDGYAPTRTRMLGLLREEGVGNVVILTGDAHSSWAFDITDAPYDAAVYDAATGQGSLAVEFVAPSVSSPYTIDGTETDAPPPHQKFVERLRRGYLLVDVTAERVQAEWYLLSSVLTQVTDETLAASYVARSGENRLVLAESPALPRAGAAELAP
jgi:alkaline phosphatase D